MAENMLTEKTLSLLNEGEGFWYLGSPYSKYPLGYERAARVIEQIAGELIKRHVKIFCPIAHCHAIAMASGIDPLAHEIWMEQDEAYFPAARGLIVAMMLSYEDSTGLTQERGDFIKAGRPVWLLNPALLGFYGV